MRQRVKISASITSGNWMHLENDLRVLEKEGIDYIHYNVMDGFFTPDYSIGSQIINNIKENTTIHSDYHLMVEEPSRIFNNFSPVEGDILSIHYEACRNLHRDLIKIKHLGFKTGVVLNPATPVNTIEYIIDDIDIVVIMTVNPGYTGQKLVSQTFKKIEMLNEMRVKENLSFEISVFGNVDAENVPIMVANGADILIGDSSGLFLKDGTPLEESIRNLRSSIEKGLEHK